MAKPGAFETTFAALKNVLKPFERHFDVVKDTRNAYYLASKTAKTRSKAAIWFGGVEIKKNYVSFHLISVSAAPQLVKDLSPSLKKRMQGKSCFNFADVEPAHLKELDVVTKRGYADFIKQFP